MYISFTIMIGSSFYFMLFRVFTVINKLIVVGTNYDITEGAVLWSHAEGAIL
jgi:hypothetical protein